VIVPVVMIFKQALQSYRYVLLWTNDTQYKFVLYSTCVYWYYIVFFIIIDGKKSNSFIARSFSFK